LERCRTVTEEVLRTVFNHLYTQGVMLEGMILKPNMVLPGLTCPKQHSADEVAEATVRCLRHVVPAAVPGIAFLSGGQSGEMASARLNAMNLLASLPARSNIRLWISGMARMLTSRWRNRRCRDAPIATGQPFTANTPPRWNGNE
jgi:fructose-bisphosphate aldolase class 1